ncbi:DUF1631 domain-containing protein [Marinobacter sp. JSM 1782161]|uniref:DUF1631 domain-containing protein n=1 Tax=Marinobacter sp. JSM 1782161 TaxID=2685906 RepID=UPI00140258E3|nr:DUF1631 domain-containing protein [Marinobacter sp. JSM 1782161]
MVSDNRVVDLRKASGERSFSLPASLIRLRDYSGQSLRTQLSEFFDSADDALFDLADKAGSNQDQSAYFDAMRELRLRRKAMSLSIQQWVARAFNEMGSFDPRPRSSGLTEIDQEALSLVDHGDHEQQVAIDNLINKLRNRHQELIRMLVHRFQHLVPAAKLEDRHMPLSPEVICSGLQEACNDLDIDIRAKLVVLKLFDKLFIHRLDSLYRDANELLIKQGVLPDMKRPPVGAPMKKRPAPKASASAPQQTDAEEPSTRPDGFPPVEGDHQATFSELSALLHTQQGSAQADSSAGAGSDMTTTELMRQLAQLQSRYDVYDAEHGQEETTGGGNLTRQVETMLARKGQAMASLNQVDADVVNLVTMLFDFILEDRQLPQAMKMVIGRLQIPILKVALLDRSFFNRGGHPARKLLNELAMAGIGWTEKAAGQRDPLREKIEAVVDRLVGDFTDNVELFSELLAEFSHFMDLDRRRRELVEQRLRDAEEGRARQERAREAARLVLEPLQSGRQLPEVVHTILGEPWMKVLQFLYLREGEGSDAWTHSVELARELVWSVDPAPVTDETRAQLLRRIPSIVDNLRKSLHSISWDPFASDALIRDLELAHVDILQQLALQSPVAAPVDTPEPPVDASVAEAVAEFQAPQVSEPTEPAPVAEAANTPEAPRAPVAPAAEETVGTEHADVDPRWQDMAQKLRVGSWVELLNDGQKSRCKLAAVIKATGKFIFVNRNGAKVKEYTLEDVAQALSTGEVSMLDDGLIFDRALESIIDNLRHNRRD